MRRSFFPALPQGTTWVKAMREETRIDIEGERYTVITRTVVTIYSYRL